MTNINLRSYDHEIETLIDQNQFEQAIAHSRHILKFYPKHLGTYRLLGKAYLESQRYGDAADVFQRVLSAIPDDFVSHVGMSIIREDEGNLDEAIWHMERAFEVQPANNAIQGELRRLYGKRDGLEPPKVRLTRGALARMYIKGELYPQAIAELRAALSEDADRSDLLALLARAYFNAGQKVEAADTCSTLLNKLPFCMEANRILAEILANSERAREVEVYNQRNQMLDPYAAFVGSSTPTPEDVPDHEVTLEKLVWTPGQAMPGDESQPDWASSLGVKIDTAGPSKDEMPDWLLTRPGEERPPAVPAIEFSGEEEKPIGFEDVVGEETTAPAPAESLPEWMKAAGWEASTSGEPDMPPPAYVLDEGEAQGDEIAPAEIPEWLKAMAPEDQIEAYSEEVSRFEPGEEEGSTLGLPWLEESAPQPEQPAQAEPAAEEPEWLAASMEAMGSEEAKIDSEAPVESLDSASEEAVQPMAEAAEEIPDWLRDLSAEPETTAQEPAIIESEPIAEEEPFEAEAGFSPPSFLEEAAALGAAAVLAGELEPQEQVSDAEHMEAPEAELEMEVAPPSLETAPPEPEVESIAAGETVELAPSEEAAATEEFAVPQAEIDTEEMPLPALSAEEKTLLQPEEPVTEPPQVTQAVSSEEEDAAFAWLESLAAKQGAEEALLLEPEDRLESPPEWVLEAAAQAQAEPELPQPAEKMEEFTWTEELEQPAETEPAGELPALPSDELPDWLKSAAPDEWLPLQEAEPAGTAWTPEQAASELSALEEAAVDEMAPADEISAPEMPALSEEVDAGLLPDWLKPQEEELTEAAAEELPAWLSEAKPTEEEIALPSSELPEWLTETAGAGAATIAAEAASELPEWLQQARPEGEVEAPMGMEMLFGPQALAPETPVEPAAAAPIFEEPPIAEGDTQPTRIRPPVEAEGATELPAAEVAEISSAEPALPTAELPDWLKELPVAEETPEYPEPEDKAFYEDLEREMQAAGEAEPYEIPTFEVSAETPVEKWEEIIEGTAEVEPLAEWPVEEAMPVEETPAIESFEPASEAPEVVEIPPVEETPGVLLDDQAAFAWLEGLAARQGAEEALFSEPEERLETPPDWVQEAMAKSGVEAPLEEAEAAGEPVIPLEEIEAGAVAAGIFASTEAEPEAEIPAFAEEIPISAEEAPEALEEAPAFVEEAAPSEEKAAEIPELPSWLADVEETSLEEKEEETGWMPPLEQELAPEEAAQLAEVTESISGEELLPEEMALAAVDLNQAGLGDLERLPGIGYIRAQAILEYRQERGDFTSLEQLLEIPGIDAHLLEQIKDLVQVEAAPVEEPSLVLSDDQEVTLIQARNAFVQGQPEAAIEHYLKLIKSPPMLGEVISDLSEALYRFPVDVNIWQALGDAYLRNGNLQQALDAYTKAEELIR